MVVYDADVAESADDSVRDGSESENDDSHRFLRYDKKQRKEPSFAPDKRPVSHVAMLVQVIKDDTPKGRPRLHQQREELIPIRGVDGYIKFLLVAATGWYSLLLSAARRYYPRH